MAALSPTERHRPFSLIPTYRRSILESERNAVAGVLTLTSLAAGYGNATVVSDVSMQVESGEIVALIGHNGAGKSTILKTIMGMVEARRGSVVIDGRDVTRMSTSKRVQAGVSLVPQTDNVFRDMSVRENLEFSMRAAEADPAKRARTLAKVFELFPLLYDKARQKAKALSGGQRQMLAIGLALAKEPKVLMLDEPSLGLAPVLVERVFDSIERINREYGTTVVVVEQNVHEALRIAGKVYVIHTGAVLLTGAPADVLARDDLFTLL
jgi:branched-chain amino acid transport system ATP-binding protein